MLTQITHCLWEQEVIAVSSAAFRLSDAYFGQGHSFHGTGGRGSKKAQLRYSVRLLRSMVSLANLTVNQDLCDQGAISLLLGKMHTAQCSMLTWSNCVQFLSNCVQFLSSCTIFQMNKKKTESFVDRGNLKDVTVRQRSMQDLKEFKIHCLQVLY